MRKLTDILREEAKEDPRDLRSRSDDRKVLREREDALRALAERLVQMKPKQFELLTVVEQVTDAVVEARKIKSAPALDRQMRIVRRALRDVDVDVLQDAIEELTNPTRPPAAQRAALEWVERLLSERPDELEAFLSVCATADRTQLRQLVRVCVKAEPAKLRAAKKRLVSVVAEHLAAAAP